MFLLNRKTYFKNTINKLEHMYSTYYFCQICITICRRSIEEIESNECVFDLFRQMGHGLPKIFATEFWKHTLFINTVDLRH